MNNSLALNKDLPSIIIISGDPGGANAMIPVIKRLNIDGKVKIIALAYNEASCKTALEIDLDLGT